MNTNNGFNYRNKDIGISIRALGNYTKNAVENFEENIVNQSNYLEKVDNTLKNIPTNKK